MCGIFAYFGSKLKEEELKEHIDKIGYRGPDNSTNLQVTNKVLFGFHRLAINGLDPKGNQPIVKGHLTLICNGEIYNYKELAKKYNFNLTTGSDCEIILHMFDKFGITEMDKFSLGMLNELDGVFMFVIYDSITDTAYAARDAFGVRPGFICIRENGNVGIASEAKVLTDLCDDLKQFPPGTWWSTNNKFSYNEWYNRKYKKAIITDEKEVCQQIKENLTNAVKKRMMSDREVGCLLSGGLDSSLISALVAKESKHKLKTFSIGMPGSVDLKYAKIVADHIKSDHHTIEVSEEDFLNAIEEVIYKIESYDTTTVRASVGNYLVSKYISENTDVKVVFNGDGSDEVTCGYVYNRSAPSLEALQAESEKLVREIHFFDVLRSDRSISSNGLEPRTPFLDKEFVDHYMSISPGMKQFDGNERLEKHLLRQAFADDNLLPNEILWRRKVAFSDGVSSEKNSWHKTIKKYIDSKVTDKEFDWHTSIMGHCPPVLKESYYYRKVFENLFGKDHVSLVPHFWMPNWTDVIDPSARELLDYKE